MTNIVLPGIIKNKTSEKRPAKTSTERSHEHRERKKALKEFLLSIIPKPAPKTPAERSRAYRARKKARQNEKNQEPNNVKVHKKQKKSQPSTSTLTSTERVRRFRARKKSLINLTENTYKDFQISSNIINAQNNHNSNGDNLNINNRNTTRSIQDNDLGVPYFIQTSTLSLPKNESDVRLKEVVQEKTLGENSAEQELIDIRKIKNEVMDDSLSSWPTNEQTSTLSLPKDEGDVRLKEEVQEKRLEAISAEQELIDLKKIKNEVIDDSLSSCLTNEQTTIGFSCKNEIKIENETFPQPQSPWNCFSIKFLNPTEQRKTNIGSTINCIREATEKIARKDEFDTFGKYICEQLRSSNIDDKFQIEIAKLQIDQILHNLAVGTYESSCY